MPHIIIEPFLSYLIIEPSLSFIPHILKDYFDFLARLDTTCIEHTIEFMQY